MTHRTKVYVAGGATFLGRNLIQRLEENSKGELIGVQDEPDLTNAAQVDDFFAEARPDVVFVAAGLSAGIGANQRYPADLLLNNLLVAANVISAAAREGVKKLVYVGSSCMYPRDAAQPLAPDALQSGRLEPTNEAYALAKLAGMTLCRAYRQQHGLSFVTVIPANAFGPFDDFSAESGHVIPALMRRMHEAKMRGEEALVIWGTGSPRRDFIFGPDLADACVFVMDHYDGVEPINAGSGSDLSIAEVARLIAGVVGFRGRLCFDATKPDGAPRKCLDSSALFALGWRPSTDFQAALQATYAWFQKEHCPKEKPGHAPAHV